MGDPRYFHARGGDRPASNRDDRRRACRYLVGGADGSLGWWEDSSFVDAPCRIVDLSVIGCMVESHPLPNLKAQQKVWLRPLAVAADDWMEGTIVAIRKRLFRPCQIRIRFLTDLPYDAFKPLVFRDRDRRRPAGAGEPDYEKDHYWK